MIAAVSLRLLYLILLHPTLITADAIDRTALPAPTEPTPDTPSQGNRRPHTPDSLPHVTPRLSGQGVGQQ